MDCELNYLVWMNFFGFGFVFFSDWLSCFWICCSCCCCCHAFWLAAILSIRSCVLWLALMRPNLPLSLWFCSSLLSCYWCCYVLFLGLTIWICFHVFWFCYCVNYLLLRFWRYVFSLITVAQRAAGTEISYEQGVFCVSHASSSLSAFLDFPRPDFCRRSLNIYLDVQ